MLEAGTAAAEGGVVRVLEILLRGAFIASIALVCTLAFVWPFAVSPDPSIPDFG